MEGETNARLPTGVAGLDRILGGGLLRGGSYLICGGPGTGKTVIANQLCFAAAARGGRAVYMSLLSETEERLLAHQRTMRYFDATLVPSRVSYVSGYRVLEDGGCDGFFRMLSHTLRQKSPDVLVIDAVDTLADVVESPRQIKTLVRDIGAVASLTGTTILLLSSVDRSDPRPERTMVDGIVELRRTSADVLTIRELEVFKFRGSPHLSGKHAFSIGTDGVIVFPRMEAVHAQPPLTVSGGRRLTFGIPALDQMLGGGITASTVTAMIGATGSGRTLLGLHFLAAGAAQDEPSLYFGFYESRPRVLEKAERIGLDLASLERKGTLHIVWHPPFETDLDELADRLLGEVNRHGARRLFLDGVDALQQSAVHPPRLPRFFAALGNTLRGLDVTTLTTEEIGPLGPQMQISAGIFSASYENVILTRQVELQSRMYRLIAVLKMRESGFDGRVRLLDIDANGIHVGDVFEQADNLLTGSARSPASDPPPRRRR